MAGTVLTHWSLFSHWHTDHGPSLAAGTQTLTHSGCCTMDTLRPKVPHQWLYSNPHTYTQNGDSLTQAKTNVLCWSGIGQISVPAFFVYDQPLLSPYSTIFPCLFLPKSSKLFPFSTFVSFSQEVLGNPEMILLCIPYTQEATSLSLTGALVLTYLDGLLTWTWAEAFLWQPWEGPVQSVPSSEVLVWVLCCHCIPMILWACEADGCPVMGLEIARAGYLLGCLLCCCLAGFICWCAGKLLLNKPIMLV